MVHEIDMKIDMKIRSAHIRGQHGGLLCGRRAKKKCVSLKFQTSQASRAVGTDRSFGRGDIAAAKCGVCEECYSGSIRVSICWRAKSSRVMQFTTHLLYRI